MKRKGIGRGQGKGYKNLAGKDPMVHSQSAKGMKQPQSMNCIKELKKGNVPDYMFDKDELQKGIKIEMEHTDDPSIAKQIAKAHLSELPDYYTRLDKMEKEAKLLKFDKKKSEKINLPKYIKNSIGFVKGKKAKNGDLLVLYDNKNNQTGSDTGSARWLVVNEDKGRLLAVKNKDIAEDVLNGADADIY